MYEFPGEGRKAGVHVPPWNPLDGRPCSNQNMFVNSQTHWSRIGYFQMMKCFFRLALVGSSIMKLRKSKTIGTKPV